MSRKTEPTPPSMRAPASFIVPWTVLLVLLGLQSSRSAPLTLVHEGQARAAIVISASHSIYYRPAQMLSDHIFQMSGARLPILRHGAIAVENGRVAPAPGQKIEAESYILLGSTARTEALGVTDEDLGPDGIRLKTVGNALVMLGTYSVTRLLEDLGCRYLWPGELGKVVPERSTVTIPDLDITYTPPIEQRQARWSVYDGPTGRIQRYGLNPLRVFAEDWKDWRKEAMETQSPGHYMTWHRGNSIRITAGHAFGHLYAKYGEEHPEWFALQPNGTRTQKQGSRARLCMSNPELVSAIAREIIEKLDENPKTAYIPLGLNDGGPDAFCMCEFCKKLDPPEARPIENMAYWNRDYVALTDRYVHFCNAIAEKVLKKYPDVQFVLDAYNYCTAPPVREKLGPNMIVRFVGGRREDWDAWSRMASKVFWRPNILYRGWQNGTLLFYGRYLAGEIAYFAERGLMAADFDAILHHWSTHGLTYYLLVNALWNPSRPPSEVFDDYCRSGFGAAADAVKRYFLLVEKTGTPKGPQPYTEEIVAQLRGFLDEGRRATEDPIIRRRIDFLRVGLDWTEIQGRLYRLADRYREIQEANDDHPTDEAALTAVRTEAHDLLDERYLMARRMLYEWPLAVNIAHLHRGEMGLLSMLGWKGPREELVERANEAQEKWRLSRRSIEEILHE